jgi:flagellar biosynthesis GTPase FlhF
MKLYRFTAANTSRAMQDLHDSLGPDAFVYSTRRVGKGIEIIAGMEADGNAKLIDDTVDVENASTSHQLLETMNTQMQILEDHIKHLATHLNHIQTAMIASEQRKRWLALTVYKMFSRVNAFINLFRHPRLRELRNL